MTEHDIEFAVLEAELVRIPSFEGYICDVAGGGCGAGLGEDGFHSVDAEKGALWAERGEIDADRAGAAAEIEDAVGGLEVGQEEGGGVLGGAAGVC